MKFEKKMMALVFASMGSVSAQALEISSAVEGGEVVVTASLRAQTLASAPAFTTVVSAEDIAKSSYNSLADLLRETVGVNNQTDSTGRDEIQIRGLSGKYTLMLLNGRRVSSGGALWRGGDFDLSSLPLNSILRVEIVRGPMAALYGSDAIGGVVNVITKTPGKEWKTTLSSEYRLISTGEKGDLYRLGAATSGAISDNLSLSIAGEIYDRQAWYSTTASDGTRPPPLEQKESKNLILSATLKLSEMQSLDFDFGYNNDKRPRGMYFYAYYPAWNFEQKDFREQEITRYTTGVTHKANWDWGTTTAYLSREEANISDFNSRYNKPQQRELKEENTYAKIYASKEIAHHAITTGIDLREQVIKDASTYLKTGRVSTKNSALFLEDEIALTKGLNLTLAGRLDDSNTFGNHFSPKAYLSYQISDALTIKGGVSEAFKAPEAYQLSDEYSTVSCGGKCLLKGNPDLKPETSTNYELGMVFSRPDWSFSGVLFKNDVKDMIVAYYDSQLLARRWINVAKANTDGVELEASVKLNRLWDLKGNYTYLNAESTDAQGVVAKLENKPKHMANLALNWKIFERLQASFNANYIGQQFYQEKELPGYTRFDVGIASRLINNLVLRAGIRNLTNVNLEDKSKDYLSYELGRSYSLSASYSF